MMVSGKGSSKDDMLTDEARKVAQEMAKTVIAPPGGVYPNSDAFLAALRSYFAVDNHYVTCKLKRLICPFVYNHWKRTVGNITIFFPHTLKLSETHPFFSCVVGCLVFRETLFLLPSKRILS